MLPPYLMVFSFYSTSYHLNDSKAIFSQTMLQHCTILPSNRWLCNLKDENDLVENFKIWVNLESHYSTHYCFSWDVFWGWPCLPIWMGLLHNKLVLENQCSTNCSWDQNQFWSAIQNKSLHLYIPSDPCVMSPIAFLSFAKTWDVHSECIYIANYRMHIYIYPVVCRNTSSIEIPNAKKRLLKNNPADPSLLFIRP